MKIRIYVFASVKEICGFEEDILEIPENFSVGDVVNILMEKFIALKEMECKLFFAINEVYCNENTILNNGDILAIFPPVSGG